jgi:phosphohistidine phosphatase SixA
MLRGRDLPRMSLTLDLLRHGLSSPCGPGGDRLRELSEQGVSDLEALARTLASEDWAPGRIFASPYRRALQTASLVARGASAAAAVEPLPALEPENEPEAVLDALAGLGVTAGHALLVGHQPLLGLLVGHLTGTGHSLAAGTLVRVECPEGAGRGAGRVVRILAPGEPPGS